MEFSLKYVVLLAIGLFAILIILTVVSGLSGESNDMVAWVLDSLRSAANIDFGGP